MKILFLSYSNTIRSQIAQALARAIFGKDAKIFSAGLEPKGEIHPFAIQVMQEIYMDISHQQQPTSIDSINLEEADIVITLTQERHSLPLKNNQQHYHWPFFEPINPYLTPSEQLEDVRIIRDELKRRIVNLKKELNNKAKSY